MTVQLGAFLRTTLPLGFDALADHDSGRHVGGPHDGLDDAKAARGSEAQVN